MDGIFIRRKTNSWLIFLLLCGIFLAALYVFLNIMDAEATGELLILLIMGILCGFAAITPMLLNHGAYIHIEENRIQAKYHWFGRLDCSMDDVEFAFPQVNTLTVLLKNGKRHVIMGVENSWGLGSAIRRQCFAVECEAPDSIKQKLFQAQAKRKKELGWVFGGIALMFVIILLAVLLTGGRDLHEFRKMDWILFSVLGFAEVLTLIGTFCAAQRCGKHLLPIEQLKYRLHGAIIATQPLPTNKAAAVYTNENHTGRIVVCGFPNDESVYYCVQKILRNYKLETVYTSEIYDSIEELPDEDFSELIDMTSYLRSN